MSPTDTLIAVDVHTNGAVALFDQAGRLLAFDRMGGLDGPAMRAAAAEVLGASNAIHWLVSAGHPARQAVWERAAMREGVRVQRVGQPDWQSELLGDDLDPAARQEATVDVARAAIAAAGLGEARPSMSEARAICVGLWAARRLQAAAVAPQGAASARGLASARNAKASSQGAHLRAPRALQQVA